MPLGSHFHDCIDFYGVAFSASTDSLVLMASTDSLVLMASTDSLVLMASTDSLGGRFMIKKLQPNFNI